MTTTICGLFRGTSTVLQLWTESWETAFENKINLVGGGEITGHLLDAAMASIASNVIVAEGLYPSKLIKLVTFGHSRTGDQNFAAAHDRLRLSDKAHCPVDKKPEFCYNDTFARSIMLPLSSAAYSTTPQRCLANAIRGTQLKRQITVPCSEKSKSDYCSGFTAISHADKAISISFRGTVTSWQLLLEGVETVFGTRIRMPAGGMVSSYFYKAFFAIWDAGMMSDLAELIANNDGYELWITGHSLGGAIATIAANWIAFEKIVPATKIKLITFGEPRVGDYEYASIHDSMLPYSYRVTHKADLVPHLPMKHLNGYRHHGDEVWYNNDMTNGSEYQQCRMHETDGCSNSKMIDTSISDHLHYFGIHISGYGMRGCFKAEIKSDEYSSLPFEDKL
ncbi:Lipase -like protein [Toxocara canis]|uniref:Lipase-like protein n=1 Tax=Toxocara canis TaxID=6265 RepID=A0A0B2VWF0_TOXCA|nr:Lipase -like protein [Toxocara canis]